MIRETGIGLLVLALATALTGCANQQAVAPQLAVPAVAAPQAYTIQPGDTLDIKFFYNPELNETVTVRPDGIISLQLIDEVHVAAMQPRELDAQLTEKYARELKEPVVTVIVKSFAGQRIYVGGEVNQQGLITMASGLTALQAVMQSGGFKVTAQPTETLVLRKGANRRPVPLRVDLGAILAGDQRTEDFVLRPDDIVYVPKSPIAMANQFVNQYIEQLLLFRGVSLGFSYEINKSNTTD